MKIYLRVIPNAKKPEVISEKGILKVKVDAPAMKGKANLRLQEILAKYFSVPKSSIQVLKGKNSRNKVVEVLK